MQILGTIDALMSVFYFHDRCFVLVAVTGDFTNYWFKFNPSRF